MRKSLVKGVFTLVVLLCLVSVPTTAQEKVKITLLHIWTGTRVPLVEEVIAKFEERYPHIEVEHQLVASHELVDKTLVGLASGAAPDVIMGTYFNIAEWAYMGGVLPLDQFIEEDGIDLRDYYYESLIPLTQFQGKTITLPQMGGPTEFLLFYNIPHFDEAGLDSRRGPADWHELEQYAKRLTIMNEQGNIVRNGFHIRASANSFADWLFLNGGEPALWPVDGKFTFHQELGQETLTWMLDFTESVSRDFATLTRYQQQNGSYAEAFLNQSTSMTADGVWIIQQAHAQGFRDFGVALQPPAPGKEPRYLSEPGWGYFIPATCKHPKEAWEFMKFFTLDPEGAGEFLIAQGRPSAVQEINLDPILFDMNPYWHVIMEGYNRSVPFALSLPKVAEEPLDNAVKAVLRRELTVQEALNEAARLMQLEYDERRFD